MNSFQLKLICFLLALLIVILLRFLGNSIKKLILSMLIPIAIIYFLITGKLSVTNFFISIFIIIIPLSISIIYKKHKKKV